MTEPKQKPEPKPKLIKMIREADGQVADVHPSEVDNYKQGDFKECK